MLKLKDIIENQNPGVRQNPYKYRIVCILDIYNHDKDEESLNNFRKGVGYTNIQDIPKEYYNHQVHNIEPDIDKETGCLYLKIILI